VVVHGRLRTDTWKREDGELSSTLQIEASLVGHDLSRGTSTFLRTQRSDRTDSEVDQEAEAMAREIPDDLPSRVDSWGNPVPPPDPASTGDEHAA
jgi:single-strand DNA-binding protein